MRGWKQITRAWAVYRHVAALKGLLSSLGLWKYLALAVAVSTSAAIAWLSTLPLWGKGLAGMITFALAVAVIGFLLALYKVGKYHPESIMEDMPDKSDSPKPNAPLSHQSPEITLGPITVQAGGAVSIGQQGGLTIGTVNLPPPKPKFSYTVENLPMAERNGKDAYRIRITIVTDRTVSNPPLEFHFNVPWLEFSESPTVVSKFNPNGFGSARFGKGHKTDGSPVYMYTPHGRFLAEDEIYVTVWSEQPIKLLDLQVPID